MNIIIVGNGVAGKVLANLLKEVSAIKNITIISPKSNKNSNKLVQSAYTGIWNQSYNILKNISSLSKELSTLIEIKQCGYRTVQGKWLLRSDKTMKKLGLQPSLGFINNRRLLLGLDKSLHESSKINVMEINNLCNYSLELISSGSNLNWAFSSIDGQKTYGDFLFAADGTNSIIKSTIISNNEWKKLNKKDYVIYRGVATSLKGYPMDEQYLKRMQSFQTWGPRMRFAAVPTTEGVEWFFAISKSKLESQSSVNESNDLSFRDITEPFENFCLPIDSGELSYVKDLVSKWHQPIPDLIDSSIKEENIFKQDAITSDMNSYQRFVTQFDQRLPLFFVGDSYFTMDPILAMGANLAIIDSFAIFDLFSKYSHSQSDLIEGKLKFESYRHQRIKKIEFVSNIVEALGALSDESYLYQARNALMPLLSDEIKESIFETIIRQINR